METNILNPQSPISAGRSLTRFHHFSATTFGRRTINGSRFGKTCGVSPRTFLDELEQVRW